MTRPFRLAVVNSHPIQYFAPLYAYLNRDPSFEVTAIYCSDFSLRGGMDPGFKQAVTWDVDVLTGYRSVWLGEAAKTRVPRGFWSLVCPEVWKEIRGGNYDAIWLHGYGYAACVLAFLAAKSRHVPVLMRSETHLHLDRSPLRRWIRDLVLSIAYRFVDGFLAIGTANRDYYRTLGIPDRKVFDVPYAVDNDRFMAEAALTMEARAEVRRRLGLSQDLPVVLYASKLTARKHPDDLIGAVRILRNEGLRSSLLFVGSGEMEAQLRALALSAGLEDVVFAGFVNQTEMPRLLAAADIFVLASENEPWGLVVNEAMCAGLPIIAAAEMGCAIDLVRHGENGYVIRSVDAPTLAASLRPLLESEMLRREMGAKSISIISDWGFGRCRSGLVAARAFLSGKA